MFVVTDRNKPEWNTNFGFLMKIEGNKIVEIFECSQYKMYQDKLSKRMYEGMTEEEIKEAKAAANQLPDLRKYKYPF
jgi:hypothetical protein